MSEISLTPQPKSRRPSPALMVFLLFPVLGLIAGAIVIFSNTSSMPGGIPPTPEPVTLPAPKAVANSPMIDFSLPTLDGKSTVKLSDYHGRIVFLNFWATSCTPCQKELPAFQQFQAQQSANGPAIIAVDVAETPDQVHAFLDKFSITGLNILLDSDEKVGDSYGIFNIPVTFVIDQKGIVRYPKYGAMSVDDLNAYVKAINSTT